VYGTVLLNALYNTALTNIEDIPLFVGKRGSDPSGNDKNFAMTARQSASASASAAPKLQEQSLVAKLKSISSEARPPSATALIWTASTQARTGTARLATVVI